MRADPSAPALPPGVLLADGLTEDEAVAVALWNNADDADPAEKSLAEAARMRYVQIPMTTHRPPTSAQITEFMSIVMDPANQPVYVHCVGGRHRTGVMTAVYRMTHDGWSADQAFKEMKRYKFGADFLHPEFKRFVYRYPTTLAQATPAPAPIGSAKAGG